MYIYVCRERESHIHTHMYASLQVHLFMCVNDSHETVEIPSKFEALLKKCRSWLVEFKFLGPATSKFKRKLKVESNKKFKRPSGPTLISRCSVKMWKTLQNISILESTVGSVVLEIVNGTDSHLGVSVTGKRTTVETHLYIFDTFLLIFCISLYIFV